MIVKVAESSDIGIFRPTMRIPRGLKGGHRDGLSPPPNPCGCESADYCVSTRVAYTMKCSAERPPPEGCGCRTRALGRIEVEADESPAGPPVL